MYTKKQFCSVFFLVVILFIASCKEKKTSPPDTTPPITDTTNVMGYTILNKLPGIWNGPVTSSTMLGSYPEWVVDMRPISAAQISSKNELDSLNDILLSFFIVKHNKQYKMAFRNGGGFAGMKRISYAVIDSVNETGTQSYYRFSDFAAGYKRTFTEVVFKGDSFLLTSYTNKYGNLSAPVIHMSWRAGIQDRTAAQPAITKFSFPKKELVKDFSTTFDGRADAVFYDLASDPYSEPNQPYLGKTTVNFSFGGGLTPVATNKVILIITTQPLLTGFTPNLGNLKFRSRYVILNANQIKFDFVSMHPGSYYLFALYDKNGDGTFTSGDYFSSNNQAFTLAEKGTTSLNCSIDFAIP